MNLQQNFLNPPSRRRFRRPLGLALLCGAALAVNAADPDSVDLTPKWPVGRRLVTRIVVDQTQQMRQASGASMNQRIRQEQTVALDIQRRLADGGYVVGLKFLAMKMSVGVGERILMNYDSAQPEKASASAAPLREAMNKVFQAHITMELDPRGEVRKVNGLKEMLSSVLGGSNAGAQMLKGMFNEESIKQMGVLPQGLPGRVVKLGESWPYALDLKMGPLGQLHIAMKYTFHGWENRDGRRCVVLRYAGTLASKGADPNSPTQIKITDGHMEGTSWFDPQAGLMRETSGTQTMNMQVSAMGKNVTMVMRQKVSNKLIGVEPIPKP